MFAFGFVALISSVSFVPTANAQFGIDIPDIGVPSIEDVIEKGKEELEDTTDNSDVSLRDIRSITFFPKKEEAEVRIEGDNTLLYYLATDEIYSILFSVFKGQYTRNTELLLALDGDGKDSGNDYVTEVWLSQEDFDLFEGNFETYLKYNLDAQEYKSSDEYKQKLEEQEQQAQ